MFAALRREGKVFIPAGCVTPCARAATGCVVLPGAGAAADTGTDPAVTGRGQLQPAEPFAISGRGFLKPSCAFCLFSLAGVSSALCAGSWLGRMGWDSWDASTEIMKAEHPRLFFPFPRPRVPIFTEHTFTLTPVTVSFLCPRCRAWDLHPAQFSLQGAVILPGPCSMVFTEQNTEFSVGP